MKPDFKKIIVERPREGKVRGHKKFRDKTTKIRAIDDIIDQQYNDPFMDLPPRESIRNRRYERFQTDLLGPLRGYLQSRLRRPWDEVWSEICRTNKGHMGSHLRDHVLMEVQIDVSKVGEINLYDSKGDPIRAFRSSGETFYVHPLTKTLELFLPYFKLRKMPSKIVRMDGKDYFKTINGWHEVQIIPVDSGMLAAERFKNIWWSRDEHSVIVARRQVDKRLCRRLDKKRQQIVGKAA